MLMSEDGSYRSDKRIMIPGGEHDKDGRYIDKDLLPIISHEFRSPITSVRSLSEILHDNPNIDIQKRQKFLNIIISETERLTRLVDRLLDGSELIHPA